MLLGVAQVVVNVGDLEGSAGALRAAGYEQTFTEAGLPNHEAKAAMQSQPRDALTLAHFAAPPQGTAVELTAYDGDTGGRAAYELRRPANPGADPALVVLAAADPGASRTFWTGALGFSERDDGLLANRPVTPSWRLELRIEDGGTSPGSTTVDADGCVLVTLLSTDVAADLAATRAAAGSLRSCGPWVEQVAGRALEVAVVEGPSGELVELIALPRRDQSAPREDSNA